MLSYKIENQNLVRLDSDKIIADSRNIVKCVITFDSAWSDLTVTAHFMNGNFVKSVFEVQNNVQFNVPWEVLHQGNLRVYVEGFSEDTKLVTAPSPPVRIYPSGIFPPIRHIQERTKNLIDQVLTRFSQTENRVDRLYDDVEEGIFDGKLEFNWDGTSLGIRRKGETEYQYSDLKGSKGNTGADGVSVINANIGNTGHLSVTLSNGSTIDAGMAKGDPVNVQWDNINDYSITLDDVSPSVCGAVKYVNQNQYGFGWQKGDLLVLTDNTGEVRVCNVTNAVVQPEGWLKWTVKLLQYGLSQSGTSFESTSNKSVLISANSTNTEYASAKAVYNATKDCIKDGTEYKRKLDNLINASKGIVYTDETDETAEYKKTVLSGTQKYGLLNYIGGTTAVFNQMVSPLSSSWIGREVEGITAESLGNGKYSFYGTSTSPYFVNIDIAETASYSFDADHLYLITGCPSGGGNQTYSIRYSNAGVGENGNGVIAYGSNITTGYPRIFINAGQTIDSSEPLIFIPQVFDLTKMFGAGNEPDTVAKFRSMFPMEFYPYTNAELLSGKVNNIVTRKSDDSLIAQYPIPQEIQDIAEYGLSSANKFNYIDCENKKFVKNVGIRTYVQGDEDIPYAKTDMTNTVYNLDEPEETDVSALFTDNSIEVEADGSVTFEQQNSTLLNIPSKETYMVKVSDAI